MNMLGNNNNSTSHDHDHDHQQQQQEVDKSGSPNGDRGGGDGVQLKKGPWTAAEDAVLTDYVRKHGEGNWNAVQRNTGLARCGKSCRLRWANHLRPNLKKGSFSPEEERLIVELHAQLGNKWARMAAQLPGRTDNEIKNYWNTRVKRRHRQGIPLYPPEIQAQQQQRRHHHNQQQRQTPQSSHSHQSPASSTPTHPTPTSPFSFHATPTTPPTTPTSHHHHLHHLHHIPHSPTPNCLSPTPPPPLSPSPSSALHSPHNLPTLSLFDSTTNHHPINLSSKNSTYNHFNVHRAPPLLQTPLHFKRFHADPTVTTGTSATTPPPCTTTNFNTNYNYHTNNNLNTNTYQNTAFSLPISTFLRNPTSPTSLPTPPQPNCSTFSNPRLVSPQHHEYTNNLVPFGTNTSSSSSSSILRTQFYKDYGTSRTTNNLLNTSSVFSLKPELPSSQLFPHGTSAELAFADFIDNDQKLSLSRGGSGLLEDLLDETNHVSFMEDKRSDHFGGFNHWSDHSSSVNLSQGSKAREETGADQINTMHEDLSKLFNVINPLMQVPAEWYNDTGEGSNGPSSVVTDDNISLEMQQIASMFRVDSSTEHVRTPGSCSLDNMPGIC